VPMKIAGIRMIKEYNVEAKRAKREFLSNETDEISLVELWVILVKRWKVIAISFVLFLVTGVAIAIYSPVKYLFSTTIEIGSFETDDGGRKLFEPLTLVQAKLKNSHIPDVMKELRVSNDASSLPVGVVVSGVGITSLGRVSDSAVIKKIHSSIVDKIIDDHSSLVENRMKLLEQQRQQKSQKLRLAKEYAESLKNRQSELLDGLTSLKTELNETHDHIVEMNKRNESKVGRMQDDSTFKAIMMGRELEIYEARLLALDERFYVTIPQEILHLKKLLMDSNDDILESQISLDFVQSQMTSMMVTRSNELAVQATKPSGIGKIPMVILSALMGFFVGVMLVFICEFISKSKDAMRKSNES